MHFLSWVTKKEESDGVAIKDGWLFLADKALRVSSIDAISKHENRQEEFLVGITVGGVWHTVYRSDSRDTRDKNFELLRDLLVKESNRNE